MNNEHPRRLERSAHALVVLDQPILANLVCLELTHGGYAARVVRDGGEAAAVVDEWRPQLTDR